MSPIEFTFFLGIIILVLPVVIITTDTVQERHFARKIAAERLRAYSLYIENCTALLVKAPAWSEFWRKR